MGSTLSSAARDDEQAVPGDAPRVLRVFVVDEEAPITQLLSLALRMEGWDVRVFATGRAAIDAAVEAATDAILLDMTLPDVSGVEVVGELRLAGVASPVLFLTGRDSLEDRLAAFGAGADDYVTKPLASSRSSRPCACSYAAAAWPRRWSPRAISCSTRPRARRGSRACRWSWIRWTSSSCRRSPRSRRVGSPAASSRIG